MTTQHTQQQQQPPHTTTTRGLCAQSSKEGDIRLYSRHEGYQDGGGGGGGKSTSNGYHTPKADHSKTCDTNRNITNYDAILEEESEYNLRTKIRNDIYDKSRHHCKSGNTLLENLPKLFSSNFSSINTSVDKSDSLEQSTCINRGSPNFKRFSSSKFVWTSFLLLGLPATVQPSYSGKKKHRLWKQNEVADFVVFSQ